MLWILYWVGERLHSAQVRIGDWALRERHRPLIVSALASLVIAFLVTGMLQLMEICFRKP